MKKLLPILLVAVLVVFAVIYFANKPANQGLLGGDSSTLINSASATTTSSSFNIEGAKRVTFAFTVANVTGSGLATTTFSVDASLDDTNYEDFNKLVDNVANANSQNKTRVASAAIGTNDTKLYSLDLSDDTLKFIKVTADIDGTTTAAVSVKALIER